MSRCRQPARQGRLGEASESGRRKPRMTQTWFASARFTRLPVRAARAPDTQASRVTRRKPAGSLRASPRELRASVLFFVNRREPLRLIRNRTHITRQRLLQPPPRSALASSRRRLTKDWREESTACARDLDRLDSKFSCQGSGQGRPRHRESWRFEGGSRRRSRDKIQHGGTEPRG